MSSTSSRFFQTSKSKSSSVGDGWISTKKRGRDDDQIEKDRAKAIAARKQQKQQRQQRRGGGTTKAANSNHKKATAAKRGRGRHEQEQEDSSLGSFIVDDDEDDLLDEEDFEEEDDEGDDNDDDDDDDDDDADDDIISIHSSPSPVPRRPLRVDDPPNEDQTKPRILPPKSTIRQTRSGSDNDSDSDDSFHAARGASTKVPPRPKSGGTAAPLRADHKDSSNDDSDSDDSDDDSLLLPFGVRKPQPTSNPVPPARETEPSMGASGSTLTTNTTKARRKEEEVTEPAGWSLNNDDDDDVDVDDDEAVQLKWAMEASLGHQLPPPKKNPRSSIQGGHGAAPTDYAAAAASGAEDDFGFGSPVPQRTKKRRRLLKKAPRQLPSLEDDLDKAERDAIKWALKASLKEQPNGKPTKKDAVKETDDDDDEVVVGNSNGGWAGYDSGNEDFDGYGGCDNETEAAARSVLDMTNHLSAQVMAAMTNWVRGGGDEDTGDDPNEGGSRPMGMIVDGALALGTAVRGDLEERPSSSSSSSSWIPASLLRTVCPNVTLAEYQLVGVNWLALLHGLTCRIDGASTSGAGGGTSNVNGVLADEMGLGKTVQTIVFLRYLKHLAESHETAAPPRPNLVVVPASVLANWERELETFAPDLRVVKFHGSLEERESLQWTIQQSATGSRGGDDSRLDVILVPVSYFQKENAAERKFLSKFEYEYLVVDEAHILKNAQGNRFKSLNRIRSSHRLLLTGTPVQNSPIELLTLLSFLMPKLFANAALDNDGDEEGGGADALLRHFVTVEGRGGVPDVAAYAKLKQLLAPFVLRRKKADVLRQLLPPKERRVEFVDLEPSARAAYDSIIEEHLASKKSGTGSRSSQTSSGHLFTQLRKASHHPLLLRTRYRSPAEKEHLARCFHQYGAFLGDGCTRERVAQELEAMSDFNIHLTALELLGANPIGRSDDLERYVLTEDDLFASAKFQRLRTLLPSLVKDGHRVLIFSLWTSCLDLLTCLMDSLRLEYLRMDGSTPVAQRQELMDEFNNNADIPVFLLSTKACGLGINLTSADVCIVHDLDFNPFNDLQAEDRCHRIGQKRPVTVYKLVSRSTVDEDIYRMQERKSEMNAAIMETSSDGKASSSSASSRSSSADSSKDSSKFDSAKETQAVLRDAVNRYLRSPPKARGASSATSATTTANAMVAAAATTEEKENGHENEVIELDLDDDDETDDEVGHDHDDDDDDAAGCGNSNHNRRNSRGRGDKKPAAVSVAAAVAAHHDGGNDDVITID